MASCTARARFVAAGMCACVWRDSECVLSPVAGFRCETRTPVLPSRCAGRDGGGEEEGCDGGEDVVGEGGRDGGGSPGGGRGSCARFAHGSAGTAVGGGGARLRECMSTSIHSPGGISGSGSGGGGEGWGGGCSCVGCDGGGGGSINAGGDGTAALDHHLMTLRTRNSRARSLSSACAAARVRERRALFDSLGNSLGLSML